MKPAIVSLSGTYLPSRPVNCAATKNGCDRKRSILRARATICLIVFAELVHTEDGDDVLQILVTLQRLLHLAGDRVVLFADDLRVESMVLVESSGSTAG